MALTLIGTAGPLAGQRFELTTGVHELGFGGPPIDLGADPTADALHATLVVDDQGVVVRDAGSRTGTFINGERITDAPLRPGDTLQCGASSFELEPEPEPTVKSVVCPSCGQAAGEQDAFCPRCGRDLEAVRAGAVPAAEPVQRYCGNCGKPAQPGAKFCGSCGQDLQATPAPDAPDAATAAAPKWLVAALVVVVLLLVICLVGTGAAVGMLVASRQGNAGLHVAGDRFAMEQNQPPSDAPAPEAPAPQAEAGPAAQSTQPVARPAWERRGRVRLQYGGRAGQRFDYQAESQVNGSIGVMGQNMPLDLNSSQGYTQEILSNDGNQIRMRMSMTPSRVTQGGMPYQGALPSAPPPMEVTMDRSGRISSVTGGGSGEGSLLPGLPPEMQFDYRTITQQLSAMALPDHEVSIGDTWHREATVPLPNGGSITFTTTARLDGFETRDGHACARVVSQLTAPITMNLTDPSGSGPVGTGGSLSGTMTSWFDPDEGALVRSESDLAMQMSMSAGDQGAMAEAQDALQGLGIEGLGNLADAVKLEANGSVRTTVTRK